MLNLNESFKALSLSAEPEILNSSKYNFNANEKGRSMIEMLGVLAIIGVLSVGGIAGYSKAMLKYKTNKTIDEVTMLVTNIRTLYAQQKEFDGVDAAANDAKDLVALGVVPDEMVQTSGTGASATKVLKNAFGGSVIVAQSSSHTAKTSSAAGDGRAFTVVINGLPREACMNMAVSDWGSNYSAGLIAMKVDPAVQDGTALDDKYVGGCTTPASGATITCGDRPLTVEEAAADTACGCGATGNACSIAFKYN